MRNEETPNHHDNGQEQPTEPDLLDFLSASKQDKQNKGICKRLLHFVKVNLLAGVIVLAPLVATFWLFKTIVVTVDNQLLMFIPQRYHLNTLLENALGVQIGFAIHGLGLISGLVFIVLVGLLIRNYFGKTLFKWGESLLGTIPGVRSVYHAIKQIIETVASSNSKSFRKVVMLEYPRKGIWSIGFVSGSTKGQVQTKREENLINVFLPTTPNPTSGFLLFVPEKDLIELDMTVDQGLKMVMSAGIVTPPEKENRPSKNSKNTAKPQQK